jgi:hypothetical protein
MVLVRASAETMDRTDGKDHEGAKEIMRSWLRGGSREKYPLVDIFNLSTKEKGVQNVGSG